MCRYKDCIYYGIKDESGAFCDEYQEKVCEGIRQRATEGKSTGATSPALLVPSHQGEGNKERRSK